MYEFKKIEAMVKIECSNVLPDKLNDQRKHLLVQKDDDPVYKKIVKAADLVSAYLKARDELSFTISDKGLGFILRWLSNIFLLSCFKLVHAIIIKKQEPIL